MKLVRRLRAKVLQRAIARIVVSRRPTDRLIRLGSSYGGWWVPESAVKVGATVISAGVGEDTTFDEELVARGCRVWALDPTPRAIAHVERRQNANALPTDRFTLLPLGLWFRDEVLRFYAPSDPSHVSHSVLNLQRTSEWFEADCWSITRLVAEIGISAPTILKLDIEGAELVVLRHLIDTAVRPEVLCVELDAPLPELRTVRLLRALGSEGYRVAHAEHWNLILLHNSSVSCRL